MRLILWLLCFCVLLTTNQSGAQTAVKFVENKNQWPQSIDFLARVGGGRMAISAGSFRYYLLDRNRIDAIHHQSHEPDGAATTQEQLRGHAIFVDFPGASANTRAQGIGRTSEYRNYYLGSDPSRWAARAHVYQGVLYESFFPGVDLKVYGYGDHVKYDFIVAPGADPSVIGAVYSGAESMQLVEGDLIVGTPLGDMIEKSPIAWQLVDGEKVYVKCAYELDVNRVSYCFPEGFDVCYELVIDPLLIFSTFSGSTADNWGSTATPGEHGMLYSAGVTTEEEGGRFPATAGAYEVSSSGLYDIGILKYDSLGSDLLYATYLGGSENESPHSLVMNKKNELLVLGSSGSDDFPTTADVFDGTFNGGTSVNNVIGYPYSNGCDIVISKFSSDGTALLASTYIGGDANDGLNPPGGQLTRNYGDQLRGDILADDEHNIYVSSTSSSDDFPVTASFGEIYKGGATDAVVFKMDAALSTMLWSGFLGGAGTDAAHTVKVDSGGSIFVAGGTNSSDFPVTPGTYQPSLKGGVDGWIAKIESDGTQIANATFTGTNSYDQIYFLDLNRDNEVYVYGQTSGQFPVSPGVYFNQNSGQFIQKFSNDLHLLIFSTVFGAGRGTPDISPTAFLVNDCNNLYVAGWGGRVNRETGYWGNSSTEGMTVTSDAIQLTTSGNDFYFLVLTDDAKERLYATFLGGNQSSTHVDGGTSRFDKSGMVYHAVCSGCRFFNTANKPTSDFPTTPGAWSQANRSPNCNNAAFKLDLSTLKARFRTNIPGRGSPGIKVVCFPDMILFENLSTGGEIYYWDFGDGTTETKTDTSSVTHRYKSPGEYVVALTAVDQGTCQVLDVASFVVNVHNAESEVQDDDDLCFGESYELQASGAHHYEWRSSDGALVSNNPAPVITPRDTTEYYVTLTEASGCMRRDTVQINVIPGINPQFEWEKISDCLSRPEIMVRSTTDSLQSGDTWFIDFGDGVTSDLEEVRHRFESDGVYNIRLVTNREFCVYENTVAVPIFELFVPNVITPESPGHNDVFTIRFGPDADITPADFGYAVSLAVYNRWGDVVFETDNYQYDWSGAGLPAGTYFYEMTIEGHATCKSWIQLMK